MNSKRKRSPKKPMSRSKEKNNYQDQAEVREYDKGYRAGKDKRGIDKRAGKAVEYSDTNNPMWYAHNKQLLDATASFPYSWPVGARLHTDDPTIDTSSVPGIMAFYVVPSVGIAKDANAPINVAARNIYSYVRHANSGAKNYDSIDLMKYYIAMDSCYSYLSFLQRLYGVVRLSSITNRYYPQALVQAMGVNYDSVYGNLADLNYMINAFAVKIQSMCVPATMSYFIRHAWMYSGYYLDSESDKAQLYMFTPQGFFVYTEPESPTAGEKLWPLVYTEFVTKGTAPGPGLTYQDLVNFGNTLINPILASEDFNIMSGDTLKAFGDNGIIKVDVLATDYTVLPSYDEMVLSQIMNATMLGYPVTEGNNRYQIVEATNSQNAPAGYLTSDPILRSGVSNLGINVPSQYLDKNINVNYTSKFGVATNLQPVSDNRNLYAAYRSKRFITFQDGNVTPERTMEATRLTYMMPADYPTNAGGIAPNIIDGKVYPFPALIRLDDIASEWIATAVIYRYEVSPNNNYQWQLGASPRIFTSLPLIIDETGLQLTAAGNDAMFGASPFLRVIGELSNFDWHPAVYPQYFTLRSWELVGTTDPTAIMKWELGDTIAPLIDLGYYALIGREDIRKLTATALLSQFSVPQMGSFDNKLR